MDLKCLFENNYNVIFKVAARITKNKTQAQDLISETYIDILERGKQFPTVNPDFIKWITVYLKLHKLSKYGRYQKQLHGREVLLDYTKEIPQAEHTNQTSGQALHRVKLFKASLDPLDTVLFELIYERGLSSKKICAMYKGIKVHSLQKLSEQLRKKINDIKRN